VPYTDQEPDEPKPPDIVRSKSDTCAQMLSAVIDVPIAGEDPKVPERLQEPFDETVDTDDDDDSLDVPVRLQDFFNRVVDEGDLYDDEQDYLAASAGAF